MQPNHYFPAIRIVGPFTVRLERENVHLYDDTVGLLDRANVPVDHSHRSLVITDSRLRAQAQANLNLRREHSGRNGVGGRGDYVWRQAFRAVGSPSCPAYEIEKADCCLYQCALVRRVLLNREEGAHISDYEGVLDLGKLGLRFLNLLVSDRRFRLGLREL
jgi:hypothetical protein